MSVPGVGFVAWVEGVDVNVSEAGFEDGYGYIVFVDVCDGWR